MALAIVDTETFDFSPCLFSPGGRESCEEEFWRRKGGIMMEEGESRGLLRSFLNQARRAVREAINNASGLVIYELRPWHANCPHRESAYVIHYTWGYE